MMYWYWIHVYCGDRVLGSFYSQSTGIALKEEINHKYGSGNWTKYVKE